MIEPSQITAPIRLDDLISAIKTVHEDPAGTADRCCPGCRSPRRSGRPPDRPTSSIRPRRSGASWDRHRQEHGRHQTGRNRSGSSRRPPRTRSTRAKASTGSPPRAPQRRRRIPEQGPTPPATRRSAPPTCCWRCSPTPTRWPPDCSPVRAVDADAAAAVVTLPPGGDDMPALIPFSGAAPQGAGADVSARHFAWGTTTSAPNTSCSRSSRPRTGDGPPATRSASTNSGPRTRSSRCSGRCPKSDPGMKPAPLAVETGS